MSNPVSPSARSPETQKERTAINRLEILITRIEDWEGAALTESVRIGDELLLDIKQCLESIVSLAADPGQGAPPCTCEHVRGDGGHINRGGVRRNATCAIHGDSLAAPARTVQAEQPKSCEECQHVFSAADLAAEDRDAWGHPCFGTRFLRANCESHRGTVQAEPAPQAADKFDVLERLHAILTRYGIASRTMNHVLVTDLVTWAADSARQSASLGRETRVPHPPEPACTNCGELAKPSHYVDFVGPFCEGCWTHLKEYFAAARQETPAVPPAWQPIETAPKDGSAILVNDGTRTWQTRAITPGQPSSLRGWMPMPPPSSVSAPERTT